MSSRTRHGCGTGTDRLYGGSGTVFAEGRGYLPDYWVLADRRPHSCAHWEGVSGDRPEGRVNRPKPRPTDVPRSPYGSPSLFRKPLYHCGPRSKECRSGVERDGPKVPFTPNPFVLACTGSPAFPHTRCLFVGLRHDSRSHGGAKRSRVVPSRTTFLGPLSTIPLK